MIFLSLSYSSPFDKLDSYHGAHGILSLSSWNVSSDNEAGNLIREDGKLPTNDHRSFVSLGYA